MTTNITTYSLSPLTKVWSLLLCFFLCCGYCTAQRSKAQVIDSLLAKISLAQEDTNKVKLLHKLAKLYPDYDPNKGLEISRQSLALAEKLDWAEGAVSSLLYIGINESSRTEYTSAQRYYMLALEKAREIGNQYLVCLALEHCGIVHYDENNYPEALAYFFDALTIGEELRNKEGMYIIFEYIGRVYEAQKHYDKALGFYKKSYSAALAMGEKKAKAKNLINIGQVYQQLDRNEEALACFNESVKVFGELNDEGGVAVSLADIGLVNLQRHKYDSALLVDFQALHIYEKYADRLNIATVNENIGKTYLAIVSDTSGAVMPDSLTNKNSNIQKAFFYLHKSEQMCKELSYLDGLYTTYADLSIAHELSGNYAASLAAYKTYITIRDSIYSDENNIKIANLEISREVARKDQELKIKRLELSKKRNENIYFAAGIVLLLIITFVLYRNISTQKKLNATISSLVNEQERTIAARTHDLTATNKKLVGLIQFNMHNLREPITRILGLLMLKEEMSKEEFNDTCLPMVEDAVNDLDSQLKEVIKTTEQTA